MTLVITTVVAASTRHVLSTRGEGRPGVPPNTVKQAADLSQTDAQPDLVWTTKLKFGHGLEGRAEMFRYSRVWFATSSFDAL